MKKPNMLLLFAILAPATFVMIKFNQDYNLPIWAIILTSGTTSLAALGLERLIRWVFLMKPGENNKIPDAVTFALLYVSIGAAVGFASAMVPAYYGFRGDNVYAFRCVIVLLGGSFVFGLVRLIRHIVRDELAKAGIIPGTQRQSGSEVSGRRDSPGETRSPA